jgi:hypothetical protein
MFICPYCQNSYPSLISLSAHCRKGHKVSSKEFYTKYFLNDIAPKCKCGCDEEPKFLDITRGYRDFIQGHQSRVKNNFVSEKIQQKSASTRRKMVEDGTWKPFHLNETGEHWAKGLTKETDKRIAKMSQSIVKGPEKEKRSKRMKENRLNGTIPTLSGKDHSQWKGGTSSLLATCHASKKLFEKWKYPKLAASNFSCEKCKASRNDTPRADLEVHHNKEQMSEIVRRIAISNNWKDYFGLPTTEETFALKQKISNEVAQYHIDNNVSGIVLCKSCHKEEHDKHNL